MKRVVIVGGGIFGVSASVELRQRGYKVTVVDRTSIPNENSSTYDISKVIRMEYGDDEVYTLMMEMAIKRWEKMNDYLGEKVYYSTGVLVLKQTPIVEGSFEWKSQQMLRSHGYIIEPINSNVLKERFPMWNYNQYVDGHYNPLGGYALSGQVQYLMALKAQQLGVIFQIAEVTKIKCRNGTVEGVETSDGREIPADIVVVAGGAWTTNLIPHLKNFMKPSGQIVFHFQPENPSEFDGKKFPPYMADIHATGFYGFPAHPKDGRVKIGHHSVGYELSDLTPTGIQDTLKQIKEKSERNFRRFILKSFPKLIDAPAIYSRVCLYCDTIDGDFLIDDDPYTKGLVIAAGGCGHAFKFAPVLGEIIADVVEKQPKTKITHKFKYRTPKQGQQQEQSRHLTSNNSASL